MAPSFFLAKYLMISSLPLLKGKCFLYFVDHCILTNPFIQTDSVTCLAVVDHAHASMAITAFYAPTCEILLIGSCSGAGDDHGYCYYC